MVKLLVLGAGLVMAGCAASPGDIAAAHAETALPVVRAAEIATLPAERHGCTAWITRDGVAVCREAAALFQAADAAEVPALAPERPQEIVGEEKHQLVLDGAS